MKRTENTKTYPALPNPPQHVGIIMDGNGRWARQRGMPRLAGHRAGTENLRQIFRACVDFGVPVVTLYAFSTENWSRPVAEVQGLLRILGDFLDKEIDELHKNGVQLRHIGDLTPLPDILKQKITTAIALTKNNTRLIVNIAFNYGGRQEITHAIKQIIRAGIPPEDINEDVVSSYLFTAGLPDTDLIIRTSGEFRISNFLIWQGSYAEYYISPVYWPDFNKDEFYKALQSFGQRERRFGGLKKSP